MKGESTRERSSDTVWWALAAFLGLGAVWLPRVLRIGEGDRAAETLIVETGLFFAGAVLGALRPYRVWRWPLAAFIGFGFSDLMRMANDPKFSFVSTSEILTHLADNVSTYGLHTLPVLAGAYIGAFLATEGIR